VAAIVVGSSAPCIGSVPEPNTAETATKAKPAPPGCAGDPVEWIDGPKCIAVG